MINLGILILRSAKREQPYPQILRNLKFVQVEGGFVEFYLNFVAGFSDKGLSWLEPYEGKLSRTVPRGGDL